MAPRRNRESCGPETASPTDIGSGSRSEAREVEVKEGRIFEEWLGEGRGVQEGVIRIEY